MYKKILAAVNEFVNSEEAARYALSLARASGAKLYLAFIAEEILEREKLRHAEAALERLFIEAEESGVEVESIVESGDPVSKICNLVRELDIDIVFTATRREDVKKQYFMKTLSRQLMIRLPCSVAVVRIVKMGGIHLKNILVPLRGRIAGLEERAHFIAKLAEGAGAKIMLYHSHKPVTRFFHGEIHLKPLQRDAHIPRSMEIFSEHLKKQKVPVIEKKIEYGSVSRSIMIEAAFKKNDLIVMGASEKSILGALLRSDLIEHVLRETPCNMIIFRARKDRS